MRFEFAARVARQAVDHGGEFGKTLFIKRSLNGCCAHGRQVGKPHAVCGQNGRQRMQQNCIHTKRIRNEAGVLAACAAEAIERVARHVIAARDGYFLDRFRHASDCDLDASVGQRFRRAAIADARGEVREGCADACRIEPFVSLRAEDRGEMLGRNLAGHHVRVRDGEWPAASVGHGAGDAPADSGPTRRRAPSKEMIEPPPAATVWMRSIGARKRTPATSLSNARSRARIVRDVGGRAAHVEADHA